MSPQPTLELRIPPVALTIACAVAMVVVARCVPAAHLEVPARVPLAVLLAVVGIAVALAGVASFRRHETTMNPLAPDRSSALVVSGIYRYSRNPMYLGFLLLLASAGAFLSNAASALMLPAFVAYMNRFQIAPEERALREKFSAEFAAYAASVRRWL